MCISNRAIVISRTGSRETEGYPSEIEHRGGWTLKNPVLEYGVLSLGSIISFERVSNISHGLDHVILGYSAVQYLAEVSHSAILVQVYSPHNMMQGAMYSLAP